MLNMPFFRIWFETIGFNIQPRHQPIENIRSRPLVSYPFIVLSMVKLTFVEVHDKKNSKYFISVLYELNLFHCKVRVT